MHSKAFFLNIRVMNKNGLGKKIIEKKEGHQNDP